MQCIKKIYPSYLLVRETARQPSNRKFSEGNTATRQAVVCRVENRGYACLWCVGFAGFVQVEAWDNDGVGIFGGGAAFIGNSL